jgi:hypothetical protein
MISVSASDTDKEVVTEFFQLFKTPWEFYQADQQPDVLICSGSLVPDNSARLLVIYGSEEKTFDHEQNIRICSRRKGAVLFDKRDRLPVYGNCLSFEGSGSEILTDEATRQPVGLKMVSGARTIIRIGYDLFSEIRFLLADGQPVAHAGTPSMEIHIAVLRNLIVGASIPLIEIPPVPAGHDFTACLTHDVDHVGIRNHKCDHTFFGFIYRATLGSVLDLVKGRKSARHLAINCWAVLRLPFVYLGLAKDFWYQFDQYLKIEKDVLSTYFFIPKKGETGEDSLGRRPAKRAAKYDVRCLTGHLNRLQSAGDEIGVHGIDAWRDAVNGRDEMNCISGLTGRSEPGVRMHWLFFDKQSPVALEAAGFAYDSTVGYNETVGYRAGTTQVFKPLQVKKLLELPMHIMDTALFYPSYLHLSPIAAQTLVQGLLNNVVRFGGVLTVNWHDRSIAPERLWGDFYVEMIARLKEKKAWFATGSQAVSWFATRRSAQMENIKLEDGNLRFTMTGEVNPSLPGLKVRLYKPQQRSSQNQLFDQQDSGEFLDLPFSPGTEISVAV